MHARAFRFLGQLACWFPALLLLYPLVLPAYQQGIASIANVFLQSHSPPLRIVLDAAGYWTVHCRLPNGTLEALYGASRSTRHLTYLSLAVVPSLLLATPAVLRKRIGLTLWGLLALAGFHVLSDAGLARTYVCLDLEPSHFGCAWCKVSLETGGQFISVILWVLLTWRYWLPEVTAKPSQPSTGAR